MDSFCEGLNLYCSMSYKTNEHELVDRNLLPKLRRPTVNDYSLKIHKWCFLLPVCVCHNSKDHSKLLNYTSRR